MYYIIKSIVSDIHQLQRRPFNKYIRIDPPSLSGKLNILWFGFTVVWILYFINFQLSDTSLRKIQKCGLLLKLKFFSNSILQSFRGEDTLNGKAKTKVLSVCKEKIFLHTLRRTAVGSLFDCTKLPNGMAAAAHQNDELTALPHIYTHSPPAFCWGLNGLCQHHS